ncbi:MAG: tRNA (N(6)-L-threonylcarbamoyladenosine(37)-C(2))-methylthiotransferase MtaB [Clostridia bacterium]|nr:tRNA (N(6)-L-threonylcarbamoyladenosine(37)-C(2))-methylthiotransferase MtaB [Clostridia bacterium]
MLKTVEFYTLGCKVNQYETAKLAEIFIQKDYALAKDNEPADLYIINTCTVTRLADRKSRQFIRRAKRLNPSCVVVVMGCYPQTNLQEIKALDGIDIIIGTTNKEKTVEYVDEFLRDRKPLIRVENVFGEAHIRFTADATPLKSELYHEEISSSVSSETKTRVLINIQSGCDRFCSYCVIPYARGPVRSVPLEDIINEAKIHLSEGCKELVLTGINTALYGNEEGFPNSLDHVTGVEIVVRALNAIPGDFRIRLGSLEPTVVDAEYVKRLLKYDKLCHHLHLSLQSGSDRVLKAMNRNYCTSDYMRIVETVKEYDSAYGLTTDIIAGFPGETHDDFTETLKFVEKVGYHKVHGFPYSKRLLTMASSMENQISPAEKKHRINLLLSLSDQVSIRARKELLGKSFRVLVEEIVADDQGNAYWKGHADNFIIFYIPCYPNENFYNQFLQVTALQAIKDGMLGKKEGDNVGLHFL